jgi:hypothetical protein
MAGLGIGIAWFGYWVMYYGVTQIQGGNWGFLDLGLPSRWAAAAGTPRDGGSSGSSGPALAPGGNPLPPGITSNNNGTNTQVVNGTPITSIAAPPGMPLQK